MKEIGIGVIGTGFMGKAHSIAYSASASVFGTGLRPRLEIVCDLSPDARRKGQRTSVSAVTPPIGARLSTILPSN